jgi:hypothetical protein
MLISMFVCISVHASPKYTKTDIEKYLNQKVQITANYGLFGYIEVTGYVVEIKNEEIKSDILGDITIYDADVVKILTKSEKIYTIIISEITELEKVK